MRRAVVVGHGMVGSRFIEELLRRDVARRFEITVLGAEDYQPYNRVLLSEVVAGAVEVAALSLPALPPGRARVRTGTEAVRLDRAARTVVTADGEHHPYDVVVLATGAAPVVPPVPGLAGGVPAGGVPAGGLPAGVHALRTLDDAREIVAATVNSPRTVVLGGGVLGLETACGLAQRGLEVTVVHGGAHLMDRQLAAGPAAVLAGSLSRLGIAHRSPARAEEVLTEGGRVTGVRLGAGEVLAADLLVLACGTRPENDLAARAGLPVDRGVLVGADLSCPEDRTVFAVGDCAQPPQGASGLVAQGWEQARRLAEQLVTGTVGLVPEGQDGGDVVRVKAAGLDVLTLGPRGARGARPGTAPGGRVLCLSDPDAGRHVEVVVADGVLVGATCIGAGRLAADLTAAYTRCTPVPADPAYLLLRPVAAAPVTSPTLMPDRTTVCRCNGVTKADVVAGWRAGARDVPAVAALTRATTGCGGCRDVVCGLVDWLAGSDPGADRDAVPDAARDGAVTSQAPARPRETTVPVG